MGAAPLWGDAWVMTASEEITAEVTGWPGVTAGHGSRGEFSFKVGRREIGHLHGDHAAHFGFPKDVWQELYDQGRGSYQPGFPGKARWGPRRGGGPGSLPGALALRRLNYDRAAST